MKHSRASQKGMSLIGMLVVVVLVGGVTTALLLMTTTDHRATEVAKYKMRATYLAEAAVEEVAHLIRTGYANEILPPVQSPSSGSVTVSGKSIAYSWNTSISPPMYSLNSSVTLDGKAINFVATQYTVVPPPAINGQLSTTKVLFEIQVDTKIYKALGMVIRNIEVNVTPLFQFLAFYNGDLEFLPGPAWVGRGRIHTNSDLYMGAGTSLDLDTDYVRAMGNMYRHRKDSGAGMAGPVRVRDASGNMVDWDTNLESAGTFGATNDDDWAAQAIANWGGNVKNGALGAVPVESPAVGSIQPPTPYDSSGGLFYEKAMNDGLILKTDSSGAVTALFQGRDVTSDLTGGATPVITPNRTVFDARQDQTTALPVTEVNMTALKGTSYYPSNGVLYVYDERNPVPSTDGGAVAAPTQPAGFVFKDAAELPINGGITIASNGQVYMQGDFNANPSNTSYVKQPAAVIADAVNLLSNSWDNGKASGTGVPRATETTFNFAMVTGNVPTPSINGGQYSGGLENLPRFHENWSGGVRCNFTGAMINLWASQLATGGWGQGNVYSPPNRNWNFDQDFVDPNKAKPPAFPTGVSIGRTTYEERYR
ncbi:MAG TPA: hypothetical protein VJB14_13700 [Planctomycetota bacterium]|nr:hypothetical protein [Planctomycetota bacterium]